MYLTNYSILQLFQNDLSIREITIFVYLTFILSEFVDLYLISTVRKTINKITFLNNLISKRDSQTQNTSYV